MSHYGANRICVRESCIYFADRDKDENEECASCVSDSNYTPARAGKRFIHESEHVKRAYQCGIEVGHCAYIEFSEKELEKTRAALTNAATGWISAKEANDKYIECHNAVRLLIEDNVGTIDSDVVDKIMFIIIESYKV